MSQYHFVCLVLLNTALNSYPILSLNVDNANGSIAASNDQCLTLNSIEKSIYCRSSRALRNIIYNLNKSDKPIVIIRGLEIVRSKDAKINATTDDIENAVSGNDNGIDESLLVGLSEFLRSHELNIKFSDLLTEESVRFLARDLEWNGVHAGTTPENEAGARKKDKGQGILMAIALMFGKMMAVLGLGGIGALAMKALGIAMAALTMAGIVGLKSLSQHDNGHGHESSHSIQYLTPDAHHHKRRRRSLSLRKQWHANIKSKDRKYSPDMAYHGWKL